MRFSAPLPRLLLDNADAIADLDAPIAGKTLLLCGIQSREGPWGGNPSVPVPRLLRCTGGRDAGC